MASARSLFQDGCAYLQTNTTYSKQECEALVARLMAWLWDIKRIDIAIDRIFSSTVGALDAWQASLTRLAHYEPLQYITKQVEFCGFQLAVSPDVLIPRPETEEWITKLIAQNHAPTHVIDLCTGSGCIAIALALAYPQASVQAWDISKDALHLAQENAQKLHANITFCEGDILDIMPEKIAGKHVLLVSNPPYIPEQEKATMQRNVLDYEPPIALFVPNDAPLLFYKRLAYIAQKIQPQTIAVEIHENFATAVADSFTAIGYKTTIQHDFHGKERCIFAYQLVAL